MSFARLWVPFNELKESTLPRGLAAWEVLPDAVAPGPSS